MRFHLVVTASAEAEVDEIASYLAETSPVSALRFIDEIETAIRQLGEWALRYPLVPGHDQSGIRRRVVRPYNIYYRVAGREVEVLHILHAARDYERLLFPEE
jgi:plasmid stabilization system protein ParE